MIGGVTHPVVASTLTVGHFSPSTTPLVLSAKGVPRQEAAKARQKHSHMQQRLSAAETRPIDGHPG